MTVRRAVAALVAIWLFVLAFLLQSPAHGPVQIHHAQRLDRPAGNLPTLPPLKP